MLVVPVLVDFYWHGYSLQVVVDVACLCSMVNELEYWRLTCIGGIIYGATEDGGEH